MINDIEEFKRLFAERLRQAIKESGYTRDELADSIGYSRNTIDSYLRQVKTSSPTLFSAQCIAETLNTSLDYLTGLNEIKKIDKETNDVPTILTNLLYSIEAAGLKVNAAAGVISITTGNHYITSFLTQAVKLTDANEIYRLSMLYQDLDVLNGQIVHKSDVYEYRKNAYIYEDISEEEVMAAEPETVQLIELRKAEWKRTNGHPEEYLASVENSSISIEAQQLPNDYDNKESQ